METEIEAKFLDIIPDALRERLRTCGAELLYPETLMRRKNYDFADKRLARQYGWVRVRDEGDKVTLSYKQMNDATLHGTKEICVDVSDYDATDALLQTIGLCVKSSQETRREKWRIGKTEITIDTWPWIPPVAEIEGSSEQEVRSAAALLGFDWQSAVHGSVHIAYQKYYDITEEEISYTEIAFTPAPDWLESRKKH